MKASYGNQLFLGQLLWWTLAYASVAFTYELQMKNVFFYNPQPANLIFFPISSLRIVSCLYDRLGALLIHFRNNNDVFRIHQNGWSVLLMTLFEALKVAPSHWIQ